MGVYDSVLFHCPFCGEGFDIQSKVGDCQLHTYKLDKVPLSIAKDVSMERVKCACGKNLSLMIAPSGSYVKMIVAVNGEGI